jgi:enamine deaminase RidA (YjgF/YER057c/UK114 family)
MSADARLKELGIELADPPKPVAAYIPFVRVGDLIFTSGQIALVDGQLKYKGKLGRDLTKEQGYEAARACAVNCLSVLRSALGSLDRVRQVVKVVVFVNSAEGFTDQPEVANGASELLQQVFGEAGRHARSAVGSSELPRGTAVEVEMVVQVQ